MRRDLATKLCFALALMVLLGLPSFSQAALITAKITGQKSGVIKGENTTKGQEDTIVVLGETFELTSPRDATTGLPVGRIQLKPLQISKYVDKSSPVLFAAAAIAENLTSVEINFFRTDSGGNQVKYFTVKLTNASISDIAVDGSGQVANGMRETVSFTFQKVEITYIDGGISTQIDWANPAI
jgi:type VI secretion system secreted protein Hcp